MSISITELEDKPSVRLSTHGVLVSIPSALIKAVFTAAGFWLASKGINTDWLQALVGAAISGGALTSLGLTLHGSNKATEIAADAGSLKS